MNRRSFIAAGALAGFAPGPFSRMLLAEEARLKQRGGGSKMAFLKTLVSSPVVGFPTVTPTFAAMFTPGTGGIQLVRSESWSDFAAQAQAQSSNGYVLSSMTTIQNLNRTWYYGAYQQGSGGYQIYQTADAMAFQQMFAQLQSGYTLVDFNIAWQQGQLLYSGYWLATSQPAQQMLAWGLDYTAISAQWTTLSGKGMRMTRVQAFPQDAGSLYSAIFAPGTDSYYLYNQPANTFFDTVTKTAGNSLVDVSFDSAGGNIIGCWRKKVTPSQFVSNQSWDALTAAAQQAGAGGMVLSAMTAYPNAPDFDDYFAANVGPYVEGYAYAVALNGNVIASGGGYARSAAQPANPKTPFTADSRQNIASSSKVIAGLATQVLVMQNPSITIDSPFWPLIQNMVPNPDPSIKVVTLRQLADQMSGLAPNDGDGPLDPPAPYTDIWGYLKSYLATPLTGTPGKTYNYNNTNFTILQGVVSQVSGMSFVDFAAKYVFGPAGVDTSIYNATPDSQQTATLGYSSASDTRMGNYFSAISFVAAGGYVTNVREMIKVLMALRGTSLLPQAVVTQTLTGLLGWDGSQNGSFGTYYQKNGGLVNGLTPGQWFGSATVRLGEGYDCVLLCNSAQPTAPGTTGQLNIVNQVINAFESRGVALANEPANGPSLTTVVHGASFLQNCAPGAYCSVIGAGFPGPAINWNPTTTLPTELNGVQVRVGSQYAYIAYAGPTQVNFLLPSTVSAGLQNVEVIMPAGGLQSSMQINAVAPGLFGYQLNGKNYPSALIAGTPVVVAAAGALSGSTSRPATAGDFVELYGTGMGPTNPAAPDGQVFSQAYPAVNLAGFKVTIGGQAASVTFAGLVGPGLFQIDIQIPTGLSGGDQPLVLTVNGVAAQPNLMLTISA
jgi:uncharacterized protein (TIGR03437 family)